MKLDALNKPALFLIGLCLTPGVFAHPDDAPLTFRKHLTDDGRVIWSNIPKACFSKGLLTCGNLHPIYGGACKYEARGENKKHHIG